MAEKLNDLIVARTEQPAPANADKIPLLDSADAHKFRWLSWSGLLARLSALFDPAGTASAAVSTHLAAADPHPTYTTAAELASAISAKADTGHTQAASTITDFSEAVDDRVAALLVAGANVTLNYNDSAGTLTVASSGGAGYTDEQAQDAVGGILTDSPTVDFTYDDAANTITAATKSQQSITSDASGLKLVGDAAAPGNSQMYGTNASGAKGWYAQPAAPVQSVAGRTGAVTLAAADIGGLGGAATLGVGTAAGTVAAGNHAHAGVYDSAGTAAAAVATHAALPQTHGISAFGATLVDDASAAAARATLGLGTAATLNAGTTASALVQLDAAAKLPAIDGSQLTGLPSGVSVHASLSGLASDDHPQYYNQARGDARYSQTSHSHAGVYEPAGAISTHAATAQAHGISAFGSTLVDDASATAARATLGLGTVATLNVGVAAGNIPQLDGSARLPAVDGSLLTGLATPAPRIVTVPAATGVVTVDLANASRVVVKMTQTGPISAITPQNVPTVCDVRYEITQGAGGPWSLPQSAWAPAVASAYYVYPAGTTVFWWSTTDGGATATLECNAPLSLSLSQANAAGTIVVDAAGVGEVVVNLTLTGDITGITRQNIPTNCLIRYETTQGAGGPWVIKDSAWGSGASVDPYLTATTGKTVIVWSTADGGTTATVSGPAKGAISAAWVRRFGGIKMPAGRYYDQSLFAVGLTTLAGAAGRIDLVPWVPWYDQTVDRLGVNVTTAVAGALGRVVIYGANANDEPDALLLLPGADLSLAAVAFVEHAQTFTFKRNTLYYIGFIHSSTATISGIQGYCLPNFGFSGNTSTSPGSVIRQTVTYPNAPANFGFIASSHFSASSGPSIKMRAA